MRVALNWAKPSPPPPRNTPTPSQFICITNCYLSPTNTPPSPSSTWSSFSFVGGEKAFLNETIFLHDSTESRKSNNDNEHTHTPQSAPTSMAITEGGRRLLGLGVQKSERDSRLITEQRGKGLCRWWWWLGREIFGAFPRGDSNFWNCLTRETLESLSLTHFYPGENLLLLM